MPGFVAGPAAAPAVDWQQVVSGLTGTEEWRQLLADLNSAAGGPTVVALLQRAAAQVLAGVVSRGASAVSGGSSVRLAEAVQQVAWEKLHTGDWHTVAVVWRDTYVAACILAAAVGLPGRSDQQQQQQQDVEAAQGGEEREALPVAAAGSAPGQSAAATSAAAATGHASGEEAAAVGSALWHLDMAAIMGGPLLRGAVDGLIDALQQRWQLLHSDDASTVAVAAGEVQQGTAEQAAKRRKVGGAEAEVGAEAGLDIAGHHGRGGGAAAAEEAAPSASAGAAAAAAAAAAADAAFLPPWSLGPRGSPVAVAQLPSLEAFWRHYMSTETPVVVSGAMEDWPALQRWSDPSYLVRVAGPRTIPVEVGEHYLAEQWGQQLMTLQEFVQQHILVSGGSSMQRQHGAEQAQAGGPAGKAGMAKPSGTPPLPPPQQQQQQQHLGQGCSHPEGAAADHPQGGAAPGSQPAPSQQQAEAQAQGRGYLAQHPLFDQIPALAADIREPPYCCLGEGEVQSINAWFGPAGTVTPLHTDPHPNLLCQAAGRKYVRLYPPSATPAMYPHAEGLHTNSGQVDVDHPDLGRFPLYGQAHFQDCVLEPGQMLFIPAGWWHYVKSTTVSFSVSYWWR